MAQEHIQLLLTINKIQYSEELIRRKQINIAENEINFLFHFWKFISQKNIWLNDCEVHVRQELTNMFLPPPFISCGDLIIFVSSDVPHINGDV